MAVDISGLIERFREFAPGLEGHLAEEFSSRHKDHRKEIRRALRKSLGLAAEVEDLSHPPKPDGWSVSISHCHELGGWVAVRDPRKIGFDLEVRDRLHPRLIERISNPGELDKIPDGCYLWCAKEAYFKALAKDQPVAVTQLYIDKWEPAGPGAFTYKGAGNPIGRGLILNAGPLLVSICIIEK